MDGSNYSGEGSGESEEDDIDDLKYDSTDEDDDQDDESERVCDIKVTETSPKVTPSVGETSRFHE